MKEHYIKDGYVIEKETFSNGSTIEQMIGNEKRNQLMIQKTQIIVNEVIEITLQHEKFNTSNSEYEIDTENNTEFNVNIAGITGTVSAIQGQGIFTFSSQEAGEHIIEIDNAISARVVVING